STPRSALGSTASLPPSIDSLRSGSTEPIHRRGDSIESIDHRRVDLHITESARDFVRRPRLLRGAARVLVSQPAVTALTASTFADVQSNARKRSPQLIRQPCIALSDLANDRSKQPNGFDHELVNPKCHESLLRPSLARGESRHRRARRRG